MGVENKIAERFKGIQGGLFSKVSKADVGTALNDLIANGAALMCWADPFFPDPAIPEHVKSNNRRYWSRNFSTLYNANWKYGIKKRIS